MTDQPEIAPCPFCGGQCIYQSNPYLIWVHCADCHYRTNRVKSARKAIAAHNRIATAVPLERVRDVLDACREALEKKQANVRTGGYDGYGIGERDGLEYGIDRIEDGAKDLGIDLTAEPDK